MTLDSNKRFSALTSQLLVMVRKKAGCLALAERKLESQARIEPPTSEASEVECSNH